MKRDDLQGIRGLAITSVILFHFFPKSFPNGYVGVDQYNHFESDFSCSGFLMALIFGSKPITPESIMTFYYRRIKRIVPLYLLVVLVVLLLLFFMFPSTFFSVNTSSAFNSIVFYTNMAKHSNENAYFIMLAQADDLFTHTWSLAVEMQFYVLAPAIFFILRLVTVDEIATVTYLFLVGGASLAYHLLADKTTAFNSVFCRIWQFVVGMTSFLLCQWLEKTRDSGDARDEDTQLLLEKNDEEDEKSTVSPHSYHHRTGMGVLLLLSAVCLLVCALHPLRLSPLLTRLSTTVSTGVVIVSGTVIQRNPLTNSVLVYVGDISYSLYLVHWPIYVWAKYHYPDSTIVYFLSIALSLVLAVIVSETFEKWYLSLEKLAIVGLIVVFYTAIIFVIYNQARFESLSERLLGHEKISTANGLLEKNYTEEESIKLNAQFDREEYKNLVIGNCFPNLTEHGYCEFPKSGLQGKLKFFLLGNSYAPNQGTIMNEAFAKFANNITKFSASYCEVLVTHRGRCEQQHDSYLTMTKEIQPDILLMISRHILGNSPILNGKVETDPVFLEQLHTLQKYEQLVSKRILILDALPSVGPRHIRMLNQQITDGKSLIGQVADSVSYKDEHSCINGQIRMRELQKRCSKCLVFDYNSVFTSSSLNNDTLITDSLIPRVVDPATRLSFFTSGSHLTPAGLEEVRPVLAGVAREFGDEYRKWGY